jgi:hypothetical protein
MEAAGDPIGMSESSRTREADLPPPDRAARPRVVYIMGAGRSGSTILGIALGNCTNIFCAGELHLWPVRGGKSPLPGEERARFWSTVREHVDGTVDLPARDVRALEQSSAIFRLRTPSAKRRLQERYRAVNDAVFQAVARAAKVTHIVDTSHFPRRARELQAAEGIELYLLFVVRDPRSVVASYRNDDTVFKRFNLATTNVYLWLTYVLSLFVFLRHPRERRLLVRYEAFISNPEGVLREILDCIDSPAAIPDLTALSTGVAFQGNPVLRSDVVALKRQTARPARGSRVTALLQLPWVAVFTRLRPRAGASTAPGADSPAASGD